MSTQLYSLEPKCEVETGVHRSHPFASDEGKKHQVMSQTTFEGEPTNIIVTNYSNALFIMITQNNRMGTVLTASRDVPVAATGAGKGSVSVKTLLGRRDEAMYSTFARRLARIITETTDVKLILSIAIKPAKQQASPSTASTSSASSSLDPADESSKFPAYTKLLEDVINTVKQLG